MHNPTISLRNKKIKSTKYGGSSDFDHIHRRNHRHGKNVETGILEPLDFNHLVSSMPEFQLIQADIDVRKFDPPIDSSDMDPMRWAELVGLIANNYEEYDGFVILHGTDTMAYTASALSFMLETSPSLSSSQEASCLLVSCEPTERRTS